MTTEPEVPPQPIWITGNWASGYERPDAIAYVPASVADTYRNERNEILTEIVVRSGKSMDLDFNGDLVGQARQALEALVPASALAEAWNAAIIIVNLTPRQTLSDSGDEIVTHDRQRITERLFDARAAALSAGKVGDDE